MRVDILTKEFVNNWFFGIELERLGRDNPVSSSDIDGSAKALDIDNVEKELQPFCDLLNRIKTVCHRITERSIPADKASDIHGLTNRQITDWSKMGLVYSHREGERAKRLYSAVDIAWLHILKVFQDSFFAKVQKTAERLRPLIDSRYLELCLIRDLHPVFKPIVYNDSRRGALFSYSNIGIHNENSPEFKLAIPIVAIMDYVISRAGIPGFTTFELKGERYFQIAGETFSVSEELRTLRMRGNGIFLIMRVFESMFPDNKNLFADTICPVESISESNLRNKLRKMVISFSTEL
ncbi:hypothetical protein DRQ36_08200 [bacterium]|nr:MAG: hypothetical protein DRQ36_08200 [bacterium]